MRCSREYSVDANRFYTTGQSGGCMTSIVLNIKYPDLFAASLLVAGQWDASQVAPLAQDNIFAIVSQDDAKAYPGMSAIMDAVESEGASVTRAIWNGRSTPEEFAKSLEELRAEGLDSNIYLVAFEEGTVIPEGESAQGAAGHINTWPIAYDIPGVRDWLFEQSK